MTAFRGIVGATLFLPPRDAPPDLVLALQRLIDESRAANQAVQSARVSGGQIRLRAGTLETLVQGAPRTPAPALTVRRPVALSRPDLNHLRLQRGFATHAQALAVAVQPRGLPPCPPETLWREGFLTVLTLIETTDPDFLVWHDGSLALTPAEFRALGPHGLARAHEASLPLTLSAVQPRRTLATRRATAGALPTPAATLRAQRAGAHPALPRPLPRPVPGLARTALDLAQAMRGARAETAPPPPAPPPPAPLRHRERVDRIARLAAVMCLAFLVRVNAPF